MDLKQHIGLQVRLARKRRGLTQEQLAGHIDKAVETISNIERGHAYTGLETLEKLGRALEVAVGDFFEGIEKARTVTKERLELECALRDAAQTLSDGDLRVTIDLVQSLKEKHRER